MPKLKLIRDGLTIKEYPLNKERMTVGRKAYNDIQLDDLTVSGEHAVFTVFHRVYIEDMNSTNGVVLNGQKINRKQLNHGDVIHIGKHEFKFFDDAVQDFERTIVIQPSESTNQIRYETGVVGNAASLTIMNGPKKGDILTVNKAYTRIGSSANMAIIARRGGKFFLMPMMGVSEHNTPARLNNEPLKAESMSLKTGDIIEVAGTQLEFSQV